MRVFTTILLLLTFVFPAFGQGLSPCNGATSITYQGYDYDIVEIGDQCWFADDLQSTAFRNGDLIDFAEEVGYEIGSVSPVYAESEIEGNGSFGKLYNLYAVTDDRRLCPQNWTEATGFNWETLGAYISSNYAVLPGSALKSDTDWEAGQGVDLVQGVDLFGFNAKPGGYYSQGTCFSGWEPNSIGIWWAKSGQGPALANSDLFYLESGDGILHEDDCIQGFCASVRCMKVGGIVLDPGCTDPDATNYDATATADDGSCVYPPGPCNNQTSVTYQDYEYDIVEIGDQCWFAENLRNELYANGDVIPADLSDSEWSDTEETNLGAQAIYNNNPEMLADYGRLYNWYAVDDARGLCPSNWHVPSDEEFLTLEMILGISELDELNSIGWRGTNQGDQMKSSPTDSPSWNGLNSSGFSALPGGGRLGSGQFQSQGSTIYTDCNFWTSTDDVNSSHDAWYRGLNSSSSEVWRGITANGYWHQGGMSVRCLKDPNITGCTVEQACNFDLDATEDDGSCLFVGESCDDGYEATANDVVDENCSCSGEVIEGCTYSVACNYDPLATVFDDSCVFTGDACDDENPETINDTLNVDCECTGESGVAGCTDEMACNYNQEANFNDGSCAFAGDGCDDGNEFTENDVYSDDCECAGTEVEIVPGCVYETACNFNPEANQDDMSCSFPGDSCDDNDVSTGNDTYTDDCECVGEPLAGGCTYESACNFNPEAQFDDNSCVFIGDSCDDGDSETEGDTINADCDCAGTPVTSVSQLDVESLSVYPNPVSDQLTVELGSLQGTSVLVKIFDSQGKLVFDENRTGTFIIDVSTYNTGVYSISVESESEVIKAQFIVE